MVDAEEDTLELVVVVPCFNEGRRLRAEGFRPLLSEPGTRILFVDDGSRDDTQDVLAAICAELGPRALRLDLPRNQGKAEAVRHGLLRAIQMGARIVGFLDADLATPAREMLRLVSTLRASRTQAVRRATIWAASSRPQPHSSSTCASTIPSVARRPSKSRHCSRQRWRNRSTRAGLSTWS
ncbi:MAG: glycosyltransferase [Deltaproteobacteria bacterium]|nr:MAG: glycosyltransferase [Deltaproteobacteria bacterium]